MQKKQKLKGFKEKLETKTCPVCKRPFQYRKKWKKNWENVIYCSKSCQAQFKKQKTKSQDDNYPTDNPSF